jgi:hypothetical protein
MVRKQAQVEKPWLELTVSLGRYGDAQGTNL